MNERIRELAKQCTYGYEPSDGSGEYETFDKEKFAELIVQECVNICNKIYFDRYPDAEDFERSEEGDAIKEHFGVEE